MSATAWTHAARWWFIAAFSVALACLACGCAYYSLTPDRFLTQLVRVVATPVLAVVYASDVRNTESIIRQYRVGTVDRHSIDSTQTWRKLESTESGFRLVSITPAMSPHRTISFVYETANA